MGFDIYIVKASKEIINDICKKYFQKDINDLPYEALMEIEEESDSKLFTSCVNILSGIEGKLPYAHETYVCLNKENYDLMMSYCSDRLEYLKQYIDGDFSSKRFEYMECERLFYWLQQLNPNWDDDVYNKGGVMN